MDTADSRVPKRRFAAAHGAGAAAAGRADQEPDRAGYGELSPVVMAGQAIQQVVNFLAGDVGEFAGGCALGRRSRGLRCLEYLFSFG